MASRPITFLWLWPQTDHEPHCQHVPIDKIWRRTESTPQSGRWHNHMAGIYSDCSTRGCSCENKSHAAATAKQYLAVFKSVAHRRQKFSQPVFVDYTWNTHICQLASNNQTTHASNRGLLMLITPNCRKLRGLRWFGVNQEHQQRQSSIECVRLPVQL